MHGETSAFHFAVGIAQSGSVKAQLPEATTGIEPVYTALQAAA
jgi:hypothetical protein